MESLGKAVSAMQSAYLQSVAISLQTRANQMKLALARHWDYIYQEYLVLNRAP